jgi:hypothetical protein
MYLLHSYITLNLGCCVGPHSSSPNSPLPLSLSHLDCRGTIWSRLHIQIDTNPLQINAPQLFTVSPPNSPPLLLLYSRRLFSSLHIAQNPHRFTRITPTHGGYSVPYTLHKTLTVSLLLTVVIQFLTCCRTKPRLTGSLLVCTLADDVSLNVSYRFTRQYLSVSWSRVLYIGYFVKLIHIPMVRYPFLKFASTSNLLPRRNNHIRVLVYIISESASLSLCSGGAY